MANEPRKLHKFKINVGTDGKPEKEVSIAAYLFDSGGKLLATSSVKKGKAELAFSGSTRGLQLAIGPEFAKDQRDEPPSLGALERLDAYKPKFRFEPGKVDYELAPIPRFFWPHWFLCQCRVKGRVIKREVSEGGVVVEAPVCNARVHICEVDRLPWIIARLPEREIFRLRDDLLDLVRKPWPPIPDPDPGPWVFQPIPDVVPIPRAAQLFGGSRFDKVSFDPQPEPPQGLLTNKVNIVGLNPQPEPPRINRLNPALSKLDDLSVKPSISKDIQFALSAHSAINVRQTLLDNLQLVRPWLCYWPWLRQWYHRCDELRVLQTNDDGEFDTSIWYPCHGDKPDLYFWVEYSINGVWTTVHRRPMLCNVWWNYVCGTDVTLTITDPRVNGCGQIRDIPGKQVVVKTIGRDISMGEINREPPPTGPGVDPAKVGTVAPGASGLHATKESPFGGRLEPRVDFGNGLKPAGITHYRWSYRSHDTSDPWVVIDEPVNRHYKLPAASGDPIVYKYVPIFTGSGNDYYAEIDPALPADGDDWEILNESYDLKSADWNTTTLPPGKYELKLELFKGAGGAPVDFTADDVGLSEISDPAPLVEGTYTTTLADQDRVLESGAGNIVGYRLVLHVDNDRAEGTIEPVNVSAGSEDTPCGFIEYQPGASVTLQFRASHPADYAYFDFNVSRVATPLPNASAEGRVDSTDVNDFTRVVGDDLFTKTVPIIGHPLSLLDEGLLDDETPCIRAAFGEHLHVKALATNGYGRLSGLDAPRLDLGEVNLRAFAVTPAEP